MGNVIKFLVKNPNFNHVWFTTNLLSDWIWPMAGLDTSLY